ncbi:MAG: ABC transporter permease [Candidatus Saccharimonadales bacterium]
MSLLRTELRKVLTLRSTYVVTILTLLLAGAVNFWGMGYKYHGGANPHYMFDNIIGSFNGVGIFSGIVAILLATHEYRYNTIFYTLTANRSRSGVLLAKAAVVTSYAVVFVALVALVSYAALMLGLHLGHHSVGPQSVAYGQMIWRGLFYIWGMGMFGLLIALLVRNQIGTIVLYLLTPGTVETLASLLLKENAKFLPFTALGNVVAQPMFSAQKMVPINESAFIALGWIVALSLVAWLLFLRRDAN